MPVIAQRRWTRGPDRPALAERAVHVWRVELASVSDEYAQLLCSEERARGERLLGERDRQLWMRARGVLRALLGRYLREDPSAVRFATGARGKPELSPPTLSFNLAHSAGLALYAIAERGDVGVDLEVARRRIDEVALASRAFGPAEARRLAELDPAAREREFLRLWVRHEAELKRRGAGIGGPLSAASTGGSWITELDVGGQAAAAVAADVAPRDLRLWDWQI
jgi:4'-phosphopantetheinyl transferase